jgi:2-polyprenyl-6-methoxyphenol hydroxylase-like FAD-dependent oxidoreductase
MTRRRQPRAVIIGGSMAGLSAGLFLRSVDIFERTSERLSARGAGILAHAELRTLLAALGIDTDANFGVPIPTRVVLDASDQVIAIRDMPQIATGWTRVHTLLAEQFPAGNYHSGCDFQSCETLTDGISVRFADGREEIADVLIGADGFRSSVRRCLFPDARPLYSGYVAWRGILPEALVDTAPFARSSLFAFNLPPGEHIVGYPVAGADEDFAVGRRRYNFVWYRPADAEIELSELLTDIHGHRHELSIPPNLIAPSVVAEMRGHADTVLAPWFRNVVAQTSHPFLQPIYDLAVPSMASGRVALVGDAAFVVRPHVGAGVLKATGDGQALASHLAGGGDVVAALQRFSLERHRIGQMMIDRARHLGSYLRRDFDSDAQRRDAELVGAPEAVLRETARLDFLYATP